MPYRHLCPPPVDRLHDNSSLEKPGKLVTFSSRVQHYKEDYIFVQVRVTQSPTPANCPPRFIARYQRFRATFSMTLMPAGFPF
ncbi:hypothetical protein RRG08_023987 [Elysia crispata]|uniref:Uncharacterized protein n=1 Tax=Elysia crispata TaxID=231223 RepID=A0AAE1D1U7_9GAST|nr:hypothetical protein RRG08_023987 [Elysia crispata]